MTSARAQTRMATVLVPAYPGLGYKYPTPSCVRGVDPLRHFSCLLYTSDAADD